MKIWLGERFLLCGLLALFLRLTNLFELHLFGLDQEYQALLAFEQVKNFHPIWTGVSVADLGFYLGPIFTYLTAILLFISQGKVQILAQAGAVVGLITWLTVVITSKKIFGDRIALVLAVLYSCLPFFVQWDQQWWNPSFVFLLSTLMCYGLVQSSRGQNNHILWSWFALACSFHIHISLWIFTPWIVEVSFSKLRKRDYISTVFGLLMVFLSYVPLLIFDLNHNFDNLLLPTRHFKELILGGILSIVLVQKTKKRPLIGITLLYILFLLFYDGEIFAWYLFGLAIVLMFLWAELFSESKTSVKKFMVTFVFLITMICFPKPNINLPLSQKLKIVDEIASKVGLGNFELKTEGLYRENAGWYYLLQTYFHAPVKSDSDEVFGWIYQSNDNKDSINAKVYISNDGLVELKK